MSEQPSTESKKTSLVLPDDILLAIFKFAADNESYSPWAAPMIVSHVCAQWRAVAIDCSSFWTDLAVSPSAIPLIRVFAERCRHRRLTLWFNEEIGRHKRTGIRQRSNVPSIKVKILPSSAANISDLYFSSPEAFNATSVGDKALKRLDLNTLIINPLDYMDDAFINPSPLLLRARWVELRNVFLRKHRNPHPLDIVERFEYHTKRQNYCEMWDTLKNLSMPGLRHLAFYGPEACGSPPYLEAYNYPLLESLKLIRCDAIFPRFIGTAIHAVNLLSLTIMRETLRQQAFSGSSIKQAIRHLPKLEYLELVDTSVEDLLHILRPEGFLPELLSLAPQSLCSLVLIAPPDSDDNLWHSGQILRSPDDIPISGTSVTPSDPPQVLKDLLDSYISLVQSSSAGSSISLSSSAAEGSRKNSMCRLTSLTLSEGLAGPFEAWYRPRVRKFRLRKNCGSQKLLNRMRNL